ncbi:MAG TPA: helix-hairpin-helix domain-containing protein [Terracidiphilus sp.]|nr:helix-hairpin-helix domain-containing protein [Terracidiphilus sp.]
MPWSLQIAFALLLTLSPVYVDCQTQAASPQQTMKSQQAEERVDINQASVEQLMRVPGMSRTWAQRIVRFRPYKTKQELVDDGVLPGDVYKRVKDYLIAHREKK